MSEGTSILLLHIEDQPSIANLFSIMLKRESKKCGVDLVIEWVTTFNDGLNRAQKIPPPDLILLDLGLPGQSPEETIARIPELEAYGPVYVLTGRTEKEIQNKLASIGIGMSHKQEAFHSILERGISAMLDWAPKSHRAKERETRLQTLDTFAHALRARIADAPH